MLWFIGLVIAFAALYPWVKGYPIGMFTGFIPVMALSFMVTYSEMSGRPTPTSSFYAFWFGVAATVLPFTIRLLLQKQAIARQERRSGKRSGISLNT